MIKWLGLSFLLFLASCTGAEDPPQGCFPKVDPISRVIVDSTACQQSDSVGIECLIYSYVDTSLISDSIRQYIRWLAERPHVVFVSAVNINFEALSADTLIVNLPSGLHVRAFREPHPYQNLDSMGNAKWYGILQGRPEISSYGGGVNLTAQNYRMSGLIHVTHYQYTFDSYSGFNFIIEADWGCPF